MSSLAPARPRIHISARTHFHFSPRTRFYISARTRFYISTRTRFHISARALHLIAHGCHSERSAMSSSPLALVKWTVVWYAMRRDLEQAIQRRFISSKHFGIGEETTMDRDVIQVHNVKIKTAYSSSF